ncbi:MAG: hypothetical protein KIG95_00875 [Comamonas sp.]|nr:hypothetical protein [Comamonas sp.]
MHLIVTIDGREAIPVRAIALLTDWKCLSPDRCAQIFSGDDFLEGFEGLKSYALHADGSYTEIAPRYWESIVLRSLTACSERIEAAQITHETGYQQWRQESLLLLPASAFVWRDEFEAAHNKEYGSKSKRARFNPTTFNPSNYTLDYNPLPWPGYDWESVALEGFSASAEPVQTSQQPAPPARKRTSKEELRQRHTLWWVEFEAAESREPHGALWRTANAIADRNKGKAGFSLPNIKKALEKMVEERRRPAPVNNVFSQTKRKR